MAYEKFDLFRNALSKYLIDDLIKICYSYCEIKEYPIKKIKVSQTDPVYSSIVISQDEIFLSSQTGIDVYSLEGKFIRSWGISHQESYVTHYGFAVSDNNVYVSMSNSEIRVFNRHGLLLKKWGVSNLPHDFAGNNYRVVPHRIAARKSDSGVDELYISDPGNGRILVFDHSGKFLRGFGQNHFIMPYDIRIVKNQVYITDRFSSTIQIFNLSGIFLRKWPLEEDGSMIFPDIINLCSGNIYLADYRYIWVFTLEGKLLRKWQSEPKTANTLDRQTGMVCYGDKIYLTNNWDTFIHVFEKRL